MTTGRDVGTDEVVEVTKMLLDEQTVFLVGGQATNIWAWYYQGTHPGLPTDQVLTTKDIDFYGSKEAASRLAKAMGGTARFPLPDHMNTVNTAVVEINLNGRVLGIDFIHSILGIERKSDLERGVSQLALPTIGTRGEDTETAIRLLHPINCLRSRIGNMLSPATRRRDEVAWRQLHSSVCVVDAYIEDMLGTGRLKEAKQTFVELKKYLATHSYGKRCEIELGIDLIGILSRRTSDTRLDEVYRNKTLKPIVTSLKARRRSYEARTEQRKPSGIG